MKFRSSRGAALIFFKEFNSYFEPGHHDTPNRLRDRSRNVPTNSLLKNE